MSADSLLPGPAELLARARADLRIGLPVMLGGTLVAAVETLGEDRLAAMLAAGPAVLGLTARRAQTLKVAAYDGDLVRIQLPAGAAPVGGTLPWLRALADPARDLDYPLKGPFTFQRAGDAEPWRAGLLLAKSAQLLPAVVGVAAEGHPALTALSPALIRRELSREALLHPVAAAGLPISASPHARLHVLRPDDGGAEHYAVEIGAPDRDAPVLARLHSACFTGDVLGSLKCDCGPQLHAALDAMGSAGSGVLLYLNQEGRGIGLANKMRAYALQSQGFDTVEANHRLGFEDDERDFRLGAAMLRQLGFGRVRLMTNNPAKVAMLGCHGIEVVERVPLITPRNRFNSDYLDTKAAKSGHLL